MREKKIKINTFEDLLNLYDEQFLRAAYKLLLDRYPDPQGLDFYLNKLQSGTHKIQILEQLSRSKEAKNTHSHISIKKVIRRHKLKKFPFMGWLTLSNEEVQKLIEFQVAEIDQVHHDKLNELKADSTKKNDITDQEETFTELITTINDERNSYLARITEQQTTIEILRQASQNQLSPLTATPLLSDELVIIAGIPFDDIGGGQRAAQLARCALKTGRKVIYLYVFQKFDFNLNQPTQSHISINGLTHLPIDSINPSKLLELISSNATLIVEIPHFKALPYIEIAKLRGINTVFELIDDWETSLGGDWFHPDIYNQIVMTADTVTASAKLLLEQLVNLGRSDALYLPNAANEYIFDQYKSYACPDDFPARAHGKKFALYFGSLYGEWFAWDFVITAALQNPKLDILLIGDNPGKKDLPANIHFLGSKNIDELPNYLAYTDIALLPFVPGKISNAVSPIKVFEYLFAGKPIIATPLPEIKNYPGVFFADNPQQFAKLCSSTAAHPKQLQNQDTFISKNSWFNRLDKLLISNQPEKFRASVSAIILIHNNKNIIARCLESLLANGEHFLKEIIVIDNKSSDGGAEFVEKSFPSVKVFSNSVNGCSSGRNLGADFASGKYLAFFDSDQWFTCSFFFREALSILDKDASIGAIGWAAGWFDTTRSDLGGMITDYCPNRGMNDTALIKGYRADIGYLGTGGLFLPKSVFDATDGFDTFYDPTCFEDTDLSFQIKKLDLKICFRDLTGIRHQPHQTTNADLVKNDYIDIFTRNSQYFKNKWAGYPDFFIDYLFY